MGVLCDPCSTYEGKLQARWRRIPLNTRFRLLDGRSVEVLSRGFWNLREGPDFTHAKIRFDGVPVYGDVEIHKNREDWKLHGHDCDSRYQRVILHVFENDTPGFEDHLPGLLIPDEATIASAPPPLTALNGKCASFFSAMPERELLNFFRDAGMERLRKRAADIRGEMIRDGSDKTFLRILFRTFGIPGSVGELESLFENVFGHYDFSLLEKKFEPVLWGESGLLPPDRSMISDPEASALAGELWKDWWALRPGAGDRKIEWHRRGRPQSSPERRIAALCAFLKKNTLRPLKVWCRDLLSASSASAGAELLISRFLLRDPFWDFRTSFRSGKLKSPLAVSGLSRAAERVTDAALPCLFAFAELENNQKLLRLLPYVYQAVPAPETDSRIRRGAEFWFYDPDRILKILSDASARQGMHHLYVEYCADKSADCSACLFYRSRRS